MAGTMLSRLAKTLGSSPRFRPTTSCILFVVSLLVGTSIALPASSSEGGSLNVKLRLSGTSARHCCCCSREIFPRPDGTKFSREEPSFRHLFSRIRLRGGSFYAPPPPYRRTNPTREQTTLWGDCKWCLSSFHDLTNLHCLECTCSASHQRRIGPFHKYLYSPCTFSCPLGAFVMFTYLQCNCKCCMLSL
jgi:hypothetical protein